jgi:5-oxoprolinase (ATP-hydrolysing)
VGYTSDPNYTEHGVKFDEKGRVVKGYSGLDHDPEDQQGEIVRGLSGEPVKIIKKPGRHFNLPWCSEFECVFSP